MKELLVATKNPGKYKEILEVLGGTGYKFVFLKDLNIEDADFSEDGDTFEENAYKKASYYFEKTGLLTLGEDSGILVNTLKGELGVKTRRWGAGEFASDEEWIEYFMKRMQEEGDRSAKFVCAACLFGAFGRKDFKGECEGVITDTLEAEITEGIPLSSCFLPVGMEKVYAALSVEDKNKISHRGRAMAMLRKFLGNKKSGANV